MSIQFGASSGKELQFNGQNIAEAMFNGQIVFRKSPWPKSGSWSGNAPGQTYTRYYTFTAPGDGYYSFEGQATFSDVPQGAILYIERPSGTQVKSGNLLYSPGISSATYTAALTAGETVSFSVLSISGTAVVSKATWFVNRLGNMTLPMLLNIDAAKTEKYRVGFAGSSTMQGWGQPRYESTAHILTARLLRHALGANATQMVSQTSGTLSSPTAAGFHFLNVGLGGTTSANYLDTTKRNLLNNWNPDLVLHMVGSNDYSEQMNPATYKNNMRTSVQAFSSYSKHVLIHQQRREDRADTGYKWEQYGQALRELAEELPNAYFVDASQAWHTLRNGETDWFAADKIHCTWKGALGLATAIADGIGLEENIGKTVWGLDATYGLGSNNNLVPDSDSLVKLNASAASGNAVNFTTIDGKRQITFNNSGARYADTPAWNAAYSFPLTFFVVVESEVDGSNSTTQQPFFSRSIAGDDGWWWAWKDKNSNNFFAALNSASSWSGSLPREGRYILAIQMLPNSWANLYINSEMPLATIAPNNIAETLGPWMKSLRLGANSSAANYTDIRVSEIRFETTGTATDQVSKRMKELGAKHDVQVSGRDVHPLKVLNSKVWIPYTGGSLVNAGRNSNSLVVHRGGTISYSSGAAYYDGQMHRMDSMGTATQMSMGCWYKRNTSRTGYNSFLQRAQTSDTNFRWEFYVGLDGNRAIMGGQINGYWFDLKDSAASINDGQWHFISAFISQSSSTASTWFAGLRVDDRDFFREMTGRATTPFPSDPFIIGGDRKAVPMTGIYLDDVFCTDSEMPLATSQAIWRSWPPATG